MRTKDIREQFLHFFEEHGHRRLPSASLVTHDDPSLLFTVAGMVPLKRYITGEVEPPSRRLASCQKCFRGQGLNDDIAEVGDDTHQTFFEMLGNWSIGDYFKEGAITLAWELLTDRFQLAPERLWPSIYPDDVESERIWRDVIGVPDSRIARFTDNWWQAGPTGPCGYDSEIYWDWGAPCSCGRDSCRPDDSCGGDRWVEIWNLVLMEFDQDEAGVRTPLPNRTVDTGMGLERIATVLQGVRSNYQTDLFTDIIRSFEERAHGPHSTRRTQSLHVLADHARAAAFLISDGVLPGTESRGYVLRRVIRRALIHGRRIDLEGGLVPSVAAVVATMGDAYPEIVQNRPLIEATLSAEEAAFARTIDAGSDRLATLLESGAGTISGEEAFRLHDTYGLPIEVTVELAAERGVSVDRAGFDRSMALQRERSKAAQVRVGFDSGPALPTTEFVGYERLETSARVLRIGAAEQFDRLETGQRAPAILDVSPFYAEAGGQVGDTGQLAWEGGWASVLDSVHAGPARVIEVRVEEGVLTTGATVLATVDDRRRAQIARHHSGTHFLNQALREVLGGGVVQRGSFVGPTHTTFDFSFGRALSAAEVREVEARVNEHIRANLRRQVQVMSLPEARSSGAIALLDEAYAEQVRVVDFGGWSRELCGGTHVHRTGDVGAAIIVAETSIGQGVRRVEMVVGESAEERWQSTGEALLSTARALKARPAEVPDRVAALQEQLRATRRELQQARRAQPHGGAAGSGSSGVAGIDVETLNGIRLAATVLDADATATIELADRLFAEPLGGDGVAAVLGDDTLAIKVGATPRGAGLRAGDLARAAAELTGGRAGGRDDFARGSIKDSGRRADAVALIREAIRGAAQGGS